MGIPLLGMNSYRISDNLLIPKEEIKMNNLSLVVHRIKTIQLMCFVRILKKK